MRKILTGLMAAAVIAGTLAASATSADAQYRRRGWGVGPAVGLGILGGVIVGSAIANSYGRAVRGRAGLGTLRSVSRARAGRLPRRLLGPASGCGRLRQRCRLFAAALLLPRRLILRPSTIRRRSRLIAATSTRRAPRRRRVLFSILPALALHVSKHRRGRPAIDLQSVGLLISAERRACKHAGFAVDLVLVDAEPG